MELDSVLRALRAKGKAGTAAIYRKHGVHEDTYGVSFADLAKLKRQLQGDQDLAFGLWESGVHDARVLATMIADDQAMTPRSIDRWLEACDNHVIQDALSSLAGRMPEALALAERWSVRNEEWPAATGWNVYAVLANGGALPPRVASRLLPRIRKGIGKAPNRVRHSMNSALIAIGGGVAELSDAAIEVARAIGKVAVDHGETGCTTPAAEPYIARMLARTLARKRKSKRSSAARETTSRKTASARRSRS